MLTIWFFPCVESSLVLLEEGICYAQFILLAELLLAFASFYTPRPNLPVTPRVSWLPTFAFQSPIMKRTSLLGDQWKNNSRKNEETEPKQKQYPVVDVTGDGSKVWFCKEQYCIGTWNVRSMNQSKLAVVKQEMARVNVDILGISELKWTGMDEFNSDDHYIYYSGEESLRRNGSSHHSQQKSLKCSTWMQSQKWQNDLCSFPRQYIPCHGNPSLCPDQ